LKGKDYLGEISADGKIILKLILKRWCVRMWSGLHSLRIGPSGGL
jgi:hypothetical protein